MKRFWDKVNKQKKILSPHVTTPCWLWTAAKHSRGYGFIKIEGKMVLAHRYSYLLANGVFSCDLNVLHKCDVTCCVRPDHLFLGTTQDNVDDKVRKGRSCTGETNGNSKLTDAQVEEIRELYATGDYIEQRLADLYSISRPQIGNIVNNKQRRTSK